LISVGYYDWFLRLADFLEGVCWLVIFVYNSNSFSRRFAAQRYANGVVFEAAIAVDALQDFVVAIV
jgi:hypothetical protein